jgi:diacylglycerol kinase family enzyme
MGWLAYVAAIRTALRDEYRMRMRYRLDRHHVRALSAHTLIIGNCGSLPANILLLPTAAIDDGRFEAVFLRPESAWGWLQIMAKVIWENGVLRRTRWGRKLVSRDVDALRYVKGRRLEVVLSRPEEIELDGDGFGRASALRTWIDAAGLTVRVPPGERRPSEERADASERRESQPDQPPPADALPGEDDAEALPGEVTSDATGIST